MSAGRLPKSMSIGVVVGSLLAKAVELWPEMQEASRAILTGKEPKAWHASITGKVREAVLKVLGDRSLGWPGPLHPSTWRS